MWILDKVQTFVWWGVSSNSATLKRDKYSETHRGLKRVTLFQRSWIFNFAILGNLMRDTAA